MRWDARKRRYVDERGRVLSPAQVRKEVARYVEGESKDAEREAEKLIAGTIGATAFFLYMQNRIDSWHRITGAIAYGGRARMDQDRWARIEQTIESELGYLRGFRDDVERAMELTPIIASRAGMYADAAYSTYENNVVAREADTGVTLGRRVCEEDSESCEECVAAASDEYQSLADLPDIGSLQCLNNCRCTIEFSYEGVEPVTIDRSIYADAVQ